MDGLASGINVYPNQVNPTTPIFDCEASMLSVCEDFPSSLQFDPSGRYLFLNDESIHRTIVATVDLTHKALRATGSSIPGNPPIISFSPDGRFVYAVENKTVLIYGFNPSSGLLTTQRSISVPLGVGAIAPAR
jgi:hypothetical protein